jgi:hypothetical protein
MSQQNLSFDQAYRAGMLKAAAVLMRELSNMSQATSVLEAVFHLDMVLQEDLGLRRHEIIEAMQANGSGQPAGATQRQAETCEMCNLPVPETIKYNGLGCAGVCR